MFEPTQLASLKSSSQKLATSEGLRKIWGRLSFGYFSLAKQRKVTENTLGGCLTTDTRQIIPNPTIPNMQIVVFSLAL